MTFNKDNLYDYDDACESLIGSKGYFGSSKKVIEEVVENEFQGNFGTVEKINRDDVLCRYVRKGYNGSYYYFYKVD